jgi:hypothetical protein
VIAADRAHAIHGDGCVRFKKWDYSFGPAKAADNYVRTVRLKADTTTIYFLNSVSSSF